VFDLLLITPEFEPAEITRRVELALACAPAGRVALQLRAKHLDLAARTALAANLRTLTRERGVHFMINGDLELVGRLGADGVQLPEHGPSVQSARATLGPAACIGASRHDVAGVQQAASEGADFALVSPIFAVPGKGPPLGLNGLTAIAGGSTLPLVALGGMNRERAAAALRGGARALAVMREVLGSEQPGLALTGLLESLDAVR
jgi:thiamine-phosphate pyrophosphorylase